ncbi:unnamed protein product [Lepeophtheirus salmonis]|uniref:(salmon louse) hypothetical protein n=1 Tax=Lepeophtheirus salmonis TaxID=72036 RepID=A0A7R8CRK5_LEPSM|nr:unnamed protein product [Lepeophtheirus salmonis]CAF2871503.1 unnamed protein product [Lepeophtheirus salmonis]
MQANMNNLFTDEFALCKLAYMVDIFAIFNSTVQIRKYFPDECSKSFPLTINPFNASVSYAPEAVKEELIGLKKNSFEAKSSNISNRNKEFITVPNDLLM